MALTGIYGRIDRQDAIAVIHRALDLGVDHFDTAELYGPYTNEELLAEALRGGRENLRVATKFGYKIKNGQIAGLDSRPDSIRRSVEGSLRRLQSECIDLLYQHRVDPEVPIEDVVGTMADLVREGKVAALGLSSVDAATVERAQAIYPITAVQNEYSLIQRQVEAVIVPCLRKHGIALVAFAPLARGILSGDAISAAKREWDDYRKSDASFEVDRLLTIEGQLKPLWDIAVERAVPPSAIALAWLLKKDSATAVIPGARLPTQITTNIRLATLKLTKEELERLDAIDCGNYTLGSEPG